MGVFLMKSPNCPMGYTVEEVIDTLELNSIEECISFISSAALGYCSGVNSKTIEGVLEPCPARGHGYVYPIATVTKYAEENNLSNMEKFLSDNLGKTIE